MIMKKILLTIVLALLFGQAFAQRFDASIWGGVNACQIDGDNCGRYGHFGIHGGVNTSFPLGSNENSPIRMMVELGFTNKGAYEKEANREISLNYVEIPLILTYTMGNIRLGAGVAPGVNVSSKAVYTTGELDLPTSENYRKMDVLPIVADLEYRHNHFLFTIRYENSMLPVSKESGVGTYRVFRSNMGQFSRLVSAGIGYYF